MLTFFTLRGTHAAAFVFIDEFEALVSYKETLGGLSVFADQKVRKSAASCGDKMTCIKVGVARNRFTAGCMFQIG